MTRRTYSTMQFRVYASYKMRRRFGSYARYVEEVQKKL